MTAPHLDDEQLSLLLDGQDVDPDGRAHVEDEGCAACGARLADLRAARDAVAAATVAPLPADLLDRLVATALDAPAVADVVPLSSARRRRLAAPPPAWLLGAVAGIALLVGVAGVFRAVDISGSGDDSSLASLKATDSSAEESAEGAARRLPAAADTASAAGAPATDPEVVAGDLGDQDDPALLARAVDGLLAQPTVSGFAARATSGSAAEANSESDGPVADEDTAGAGTGGGAPSGATAPPASTAPVDRARCRPQADAIGAGRFGALVSTVTVRWKGAPAEVLVFQLAQPPTPDAPETRQALVLARPGCALLAEARF